MVHEGVLDGTGGILAYDKSYGAVRVDVIGAVLSIVFQNEDGRVIPVRTMGDGLHYAAEGKIVVSYIGGRAGLTRPSAASVIVRKIEQDKGRQLSSVALLASTHKTFELVEELVSAQLVWVLRAEVRIQRIEVIAQHGLARLHALEHRYRPRPRAGGAVRLADIGRQGFALVNFTLRTRCREWRRCAFLGRSSLLFCIAPLSLYKLAIVAISEAVAGDVIPEKPGGRIIDIRQVVVEHVLVSHRAPEIVGALFAAIIDLPGLLVVVTGDGGGRPEMTITEDFPTVVEVIQHAELQR